jgi:hypothetical protein
MTEQHYDIAVDPDGSLRILRALYDGATLEAASSPLFVLAFDEAVQFGGRFAEAIRKAAPLDAEVRRAGKLRRDADELDARRIANNRPALIEDHAAEVERPIALGQRNRDAA